jgi:hypothetical protein
MAGLVGGSAPFERTPKRGAAASVRYRARAILPIPEAMLGALVLVAALVALARERLEAVPFLLPMAIGPLALALASLRSRSSHPHRMRTAKDPARTGSVTPLVTAARAD